MAKKTHKPLNDEQQKAHDEIVRLIGVFCDRRKVSTDPAECSQVASILNKRLKGANSQAVLASGAFSNVNPGQGGRLHLTGRSVADVRGMGEAFEKSLAVPRKDDIG